MRVVPAARDQPLAKIVVFSLFDHREFWEKAPPIAAYLRQYVDVQTCTESPLPQPPMLNNNRSRTQR